MNRRGNTVTIALTVLILIALAVAGGGFYLFQKEHAKNIDLQSQLDDINSRLKTTELNLDESKKKITDLQLKLQEDKIQMESLNNDLQQEKSGRQEALAQLEQLKADLEEQKASRADLENKFNQSQEEARKSQEQLNQLLSQKKELEGKISDLEAKTRDIELGKIVVSSAPEQAAPVVTEAKKGKKAKVAKAKAKAKAQTRPQPVIVSSAPEGRQGKVLVVNKEYNFAVIGLGSKDGVALGDVFSVYHNGAYIGDVKVEKVHDSMSAAGFQTANKDKIGEGDKVQAKAK
jgi:peptidoglycan hydrolase CwlO-like protein